MEFGEKKKMSKLSSARMPARKAVEVELEFGSDPEGEDESAGVMEGGFGDDGMEDDAASEPMDLGSNPELEEASDDELMAELRRRGLDKKASEAAGEVSDDDEYLG